MRIFIQLDDVYVSNLPILEPILLDLLGMSVAEHSIYLVSTLPKPSETKAIEWVHPEATKQLIETSSSNALIHFSPVSIWAKQLPSYFIPLTLPHLTGRDHSFFDYCKS